MNVCPNCNAGIDDNAVVCISCGVNLHTGENLKTVVKEQPQPQNKEDNDPLLLNNDDNELIGMDSGNNPFIFIASMVPGIFRPLVLIMSIVFLGVSVAGFFLTMFMFSLGVLVGGVFSGAATLLAYSHSVAWIITGRLQILKDALLDFDGIRWILFILFVCGPLLILFIGIVVLGAHLQSGGV